MATKGTERALKRVRLGPWLAGIDEKSAPYVIADGKITDGQNLITDERPGIAEKRPGSRVISRLPSGNPARDGAIFNKADGQAFLLASDGVSLYYTQDPTSQAAWTLLKTGLNTDGFLEFETAEDKIWMSNGINNVMSWDGTTLKVYDREKEITVDNATITANTVANSQLTEADDYWNGQKLVFTTGLNVGALVTVTDFDAATDKITFTPALTQPTALTDRFKVGLIIPAGRTIRYYDSHLWLAGTIVNPAEARFHRLTDPNTGVDITIDHPLAWPPTYQIDVYSSDGDYVWGITPILADRIAFFKSTGIFRVERDPLTMYRLEVLSRSIGSRFTRSWAEKNEALCFVGQDKDGLVDVYRTNMFAVKPVDDVGGLEPTLRSLRQPNSVSRNYLFSSQGDFDTGVKSSLVSTDGSQLKVGQSDTQDKWLALLQASSNIDLETNPDKVCLLGCPDWGVRYDADEGPGSANPAWLVSGGNYWNVGNAAGGLYTFGVNWTGGISRPGHSQFTKLYRSLASDVNTKDVFRTIRTRITAADAYSFGFPLDTDSASIIFSYNYTIRNGAYEVGINLSKTRLFINGGTVLTGQNFMAFHTLHVLLKSTGAYKVWMDGVIIASGTGIATTLKEISFAMVVDGLNLALLSADILASINFQSETDFVYYHEDYKGDKLDARGGKISPTSLPNTLPAAGDFSIQLDYLRAPDALRNIGYTLGEVDLGFCGTTVASLTVNLHALTDMSKFHAGQIVNLRNENSNRPIANGTGQEIQSVNVGGKTITFTAAIGVVSTDATVKIYLKNGSLSANSWSAGSSDFTTDTDPAGFVAVANGATPTSLAKRYHRIRFDMARASYQDGPILATFKTGILWLSPHIFIGANIAAWRTFLTEVSSLAGTFLGIKIRAATVGTDPIETDWGAFLAIVSGNNIGTILADGTPPASRWVQLKVEEGPDPDGVSPYINSMFLQWVEGIKENLPLDGVTHKKRYLFCGASRTSDSNDSVIVLDRNDAWMKYSGLSLNFMDHFRGLFIGFSSIDDKILELDVVGLYRDQDQAINAFLDTREEVFKNDDMRKDFKYSYIHVGEMISEITVQMKRPSDPTWIYPLVLTCDGTATDIRYNFPFPTLGKRLKRRYSNANIDQNMELRGETLYLTMRPPDGYRR